MTSAYHAPITVNVTVGCAAPEIFVFHAKLIVNVVRILYAKWASAVRRAPLTPSVLRKALYAETAFVFLSVPIAVIAKRVFAKLVSAGLNVPIAVNVAMGLYAKTAFAFLCASIAVNVIQVLNAKQASAVLCVTLISMVHVVKALNATLSNPWTFVSQRA